MNTEKYPVIALEGSTRFEFLSEGPNGTIKKLVHYQQLAEHEFNLAFGDWDEERAEISDKARSNNKDRDKVLTTVAFTVFDFMHHHPAAKVFVKGSTPSRTRLYQIGIKNNWLEISLRFRVEGYLRSRWEDFDSTKNYEAFSLKAAEKQ